MSQLTKQALQGENQTNFPNNTTGYITPSLLRAFNSDMIDSLALQTQMDAVSQSVNNLITGSRTYATTGSNTFNGNQQINGDVTVDVSSSFNISNIVTLRNAAGSNITLLDAEDGLQIRNFNVGELQIDNNADADVTITAHLQDIHLNAFSGAIFLNDVDFEQYSASVDTRLNNAQGTQGITGAQGGTGTQGTNGVVGSQGATGQTGAGGAQGSIGLQGTTGAQGLLGNQGVTGAKGDTGTTGAQGQTGTQGAVGSQGTTGQSIQGAQGTNANVQGITGAQGANGSTGTQGADGAQGLRGLQGIQGAQGTIGQTGNVGSQGDRGVQGYTGAGSQGSTGAQGSQGITGTGTQGTTGGQGVQGISGLLLNTGSFITTGSASTGSQTILGDFKFDTTYTASGSYASITGGSNIITVDYGVADDIFYYWTTTNFNGVIVSGTGITNGVVTGYSYGPSGIEVSITTGTITNGATYTFTGPASQTIDITGSLSVTNNIIATGTNGHITINQSGINVQPADDASNTSISQGTIELQINTGDIIGMTPSASLNGALDGTWLGPSIYTAYDGAYRPMFGFQSQTTWTNGTITALKPLVVSGSLTTTNNITINGASSKLELTGVGSNIKANNLTGSWGQTNGLAALQINGGLYANGNLQFNVGAFQSNITQSGSANVSQSMNFEVTDISSGVSIASNSRITLANSGTYNIQFSAQIDRVSGSGTDTIHIWLKKNGSNVNASAGAVTISGGASAAKTITAWNYVVEASANDYYELVWQTTDSNIQLINQAATGNIPSIPSVILTVTQVR